MLKLIWLLIALTLCSCSSTISEEYVFSLADNACYRLKETKDEILVEKIPCNKVPIDADCENTWESYKED